MHGDDRPPYRLAGRISNFNSGLIDPVSTYQHRLSVHAQAASLSLLASRNESSMRILSEKMEIFPCTYG